MFLLGGNLVFSAFIVLNNGIVKEDLPRTSLVFGRLFGVAFVIRLFRISVARCCVVFCLFCGLGGFRKFVETFFVFVSTLFIATINTRKKYCAPEITDRSLHGAKVSV